MSFPRDSGNTLILRQPHKYKYWSSVRLPRSCGSLPRLEQLDKFKYCSLVRSHKTFDITLSPEQADKSRCTMFFKFLRDFGSFSISEQPDKSRYIRLLRLPIDSGIDEIIDDPRMLKYCSFESPVKLFGKLRFFILGAIRNLSCFSWPTDVGNLLTEDSVKSKTCKHLAKENEPSWMPRFLQS
jgi:hypothetical protein